MSEDAFLSRWSRRKVQARRGAPVEAPPAAEPAPAAPVAADAPSAGAGQAEPLPAGPTVAVVPAPTVQAGSCPARDSAGGSEGEGAVEEPPPTLDDVAALAPGADVRRFMAPQVGEDVKRAALKKLFADPHFNVMDGLDTYIEDYNTPRPIPPAMLRQMVQAQFLGLFDDAAKDAPKDAPEDERLLAASKASPDGAAPPAVPQSPLELTAVPPHEDPDLRLQQDDAAGPGGADEGPRA